MVLDHNLGFASDFDLDMFKKIHVGVDSWLESTDIFFRFEMEKHIKRAMAILAITVNSLPSEWFSVGVSKIDFLNNMNKILESYLSDDFWEAIK